MKMKKAVLLVLLCGFAQLVSAQDLDQPTFVGFNVGFSNPVGKFAKDYDRDAVSGQRGIVFNLEGAKYFNRNFGIGGQITYNINRVNEIEIRNATAVEGYKNNGYNILRVAAGLHGAIPIVDEIGLNYKILGGYSMVRKGAIEAEGVRIFNPQTDNTFCIILGAGVRYLIFPRIFARVNGEFVYTQTNLKPEPGKDSNTFIEYQKRLAEYSSSHPMNVLTLSVGLDYVWEYSKKAKSKKRKSRR
jgi:hypothetical protein